MKAATFFHPALWLLFILPFLAVCLALSPQQAQAQAAGYPESSETYTQEELAQMLAPIALYPDALLAQILMASTYPIEVIEADRWTRDNLELEGESLDAALLNKDWDPSVKAICHFPETLALMSERITETTNLGNAFLAQEPEVMGMIQKLRDGAYTQGNLTTTSEQKVIVEKETIIIEPVNFTTLYIPYYDPYYVYGPWWYPAYPPYYWGPSGASLGIGLFFWPGVYFGFNFVSWSYFDWHQHYIYIDVHKRPRFVRPDRWIATPGRWQHVPSHRRGVAYRDKFTARKYGQSPQRSMEFRREVRGFPVQRDSEQSRNLTVPDKPSAEQTKIDHYRQKQERVERSLKEQKRDSHDTQEPLRVNLDKQKSAQKEPEKLERRRQERIKLLPEKQKPERVERASQPAIQDNIFIWSEEGGKERQSSERGRFSRKVLEGDDKGDRKDHLR